MIRHPDEDCGIIGGPLSMHARLADSRRQLGREGGASAPRHEAMLTTPQKSIVFYDCSKKTMLVPLLSGVAIVCLAT